MENRFVQKAGTANRAKEGRAEGPGTEGGRSTGTYNSSGITLAQEFGARRTRRLACCEVLQD